MFSEPKRAWQEKSLANRNRNRRGLIHGESLFSVVDVIEAIVDSDRPARKYWSDLKRQMADREGFIELSEFIGQLPMPGPDGKMYRTDVANAETLFRIIQSVPSPKAEPIKRWLAKVGFEPFGQVDLIARDHTERINPQRWEVVSRP